MKRFVEGVDRGQSTLLPECLEDWIGEDNAVRVIDVFVEDSIWAGGDLTVWLPRRPAGLRIIRRRC
jgi:hypothetical protein